MGNHHTQRSDNMPSASTVKMAETTSYDNVHAKPFTRIHGRPTRHDYQVLMKEASDLASKVEDITYDWTRDAITGDEYGLLAEIIGEPDYIQLTNIQWVQEVEPAKYNPAITAATATRNGMKNVHRGISEKDSCMVLP